MIVKFFGIKRDITINNTNQLSLCLGKKKRVGSARAFIEEEAE